MVDDQPDLIHVGGDHDSPGILCLFGWLFARDQISQRIDADFIGERLHFSPHDRANVVFISRWTKGFGELLEKFFHEQ